MSAENNKKRRSRPTLLRVNGLCLYAIIAATLWRAARMVLPRVLLTGYPAFALEAALSLFSMGLPAYFCVRSLRSRTVAPRLRLSPPTVAQLLFALIAACAGLLFSDDLTLLWSAFLEGFGLKAGLALSPANAPTPGMLAASVVSCAVLPALCEGLFFRGALFCAWERRGTAYAVWVCAALSAAFSPSLVECPVRFIQGAALGYILARSGSLYLSIFCHAAQAIAGVAAAYVRGAATGLDRYGALLSSLGGGKGIALLALETILLCGVYVLSVRAVCIAKPFREAPFRERRDSRRMSSAAVFVLCAVTVTALACFLLDALAYASF